MRRMMYAIQIDQPTALEWGLNCQQAMVFAVIQQLPTWAASIQIEGTTWYYLSKGKLLDELPMLTDKRDTAWRYMKQLQKIGVVDITKVGPKIHVRVTEKGKAWNRPHYQPPVPGDAENRESEENPQRGNISEARKIIPEAENNPPEHGKISEQNAEKFPTYENYQSYQVTSDQEKHCAASSAKQADGENPKIDPPDENPVDQKTPEPGSPPKQAHPEGASPPAHKPEYRTAKGKSLTGDNLENFLAFWKTFAYPKDKARAADAWLKIPWARRGNPNAQASNRKLVNQILRAAAFEASQRPAKLQANLTPIYAEGWLTARRWEDEVPDMRAAQQNRLAGPSEVQTDRQKVRAALQNITDTDWANPNAPQQQGRVYDHEPN